MGKGGRTNNATTSTSRNTSGVLSMSSNNGMAISGNTFDGAHIKVTDGGAIKAMAATSQQYLEASKSAIKDVMGQTGKIVNGAIKTNNDVASKAIIASKSDLANSLKLANHLVSNDQAANKMAMANSASATQSALSIIHNVAENKTANSGVEIASVMKVAFVAIAVAVAVRGKL